jgi:eukaryotic-like serine/threonine-protein kinase
MPFLDFLKAVLAGGQLNVAKRFAFQRGAISGSMSRFCMANDQQTGRIVGLKILDPNKHAAFEGRFKGLSKPSEGEIAIQFEHPNIVHTFEYGVTTEGSPYLVMEYLEGPSMNAALAARAFFLAGRRVHFLRQAAEAIAAVHDTGFIHRNICPRHFLLTNEQNDLKLIDFGLALPATNLFMRPGNRTGTPDYMAPELVRRRPTDQRLDVFAFGVTAYEMCAFELPWPRGATGAAAMTHEQPPIDIRQHCRKIDPALARAIHACIEPEVAHRCPSMEAFLHMIRDVPEDGGLEA